jgi:hypothetical protein
VKPWSANALLFFTIKNKLQEHSVSHRMKCEALTNSKASEQQADNKSMFIYFRYKNRTKVMEEGYRAR